MKRVKQTIVLLHDNQKTLTCLNVVFGIVYLWAVKVLGWDANRGK